MSTTNISLNLAPPPMASNTEVSSDIIYALPKTYNGKTVNELFPEFKHNSVLRFSKLLGLGRQTSLPKIWKGSRKRKKQKTTTTHTNQKSTDVKSNLDPFELLEDASKAIQIDEEQINEQINEEIEYETDDEVNFLKPFLIEETDNNFDKYEAGKFGSEQCKLNRFLSTWRYGPASYWYDTNVENVYFIKKQENEKKKSKNKQKDDEEDEEEDEEEEKKNLNGAPIELGSQEETVASSECETLNLEKAVMSLDAQRNSELFLLVNTMDWEENIIMDTSAATQTHSNNQIIRVSTQQQQQQQLPLSTFNLLLSQSNELINERIKYAGWVPSNENRTLKSFQSNILGKKTDYLDMAKENFQLATATKQQTSQSSSANVPSIAINTNWNSIFPSDNYEILFGNWEQKVILDPKNIDPSLAEPPEFCIDPNDDNLLLGVPDDPNCIQSDTGGAADKAKETGISSADLSSSEAAGKKDKFKTYENRTKLSKSLVGRSGKEDAHNDENEESAQQRTNTDMGGGPKNFWNISNDEFYNPKVVADQTIVNKSNVSTSLVLQHSILALELRQVLFPTHLSTHKLRNFHRYALKRFPNGLISNEQAMYSVSSILKQANYKKQQLRLEMKPPSLQTSAKTSISDQQQQLLSIQTLNDISATDDSEIILAEYSEQYPPLMMQPGMATKIRNFYKRKFGKDDGPQPGSMEYGELVYVHNSPFLGTLKPGECLQSFENHMFRAPIYMHKMPETDFLLVRSRTSGYFIRGDFKTLFVVGQQCPLIEVPGPNSKRANSFLKDFLQAFILRLFHQSNEIPKRIKMEDVKKAFPMHAESSIRKRLKLCADFRRTGKTESSTNWWILKEEIRLPTEEEIRSIVTPEQCCAYYSMLWAEQRLKDAGYGEKNLFASDNDEDNVANNNNNLEKIDDEVKNAPWHTTRAYIDANKGKCLLQINGVADPTGRGEGFSYVRQAFKPNKQEESEQTKDQTPNENAASPQQHTESTSTAAAAAAAKRTVTGTDADLRRLHLSQAKELLAKYGVPEHEIRKLKRWEIIDVVRTMSTQKAKEGNGSAVSKFARGNRYSQSDAHEKFREECQRLFELQNRNLASEEFLSTDDDEDLDDDEDVDEMGKNLESMLQSKLTTTSTSVTAVNAQLKANNIKQTPMDSSSELKNLIMTQSSEGGNASSSSKTTEVPANMHRVLKITRTYKDEETGQEYTRVELVKKPLIIDAYVKIRSTKDDEFIRTAFALDETEKEKLRKERRRLQEQLRRVKRNEAKRTDSDLTQASTLVGASVIKVRKYNKSGLPRKQKQKLSEENYYEKSADEEKSMGCGLDTTATSSLNNTMIGSGGPGQQPIVKKRKYQKRKKLEQSDTAMPTLQMQTTDMESSNFSKVEGTKLIIKKKAIMALNCSTAGDEQQQNADQLKKKPRVYRKHAKNETSVSIVLAGEANESSDGQQQQQLQAPKLKIKLGQIKPDPNQSILSNNSISEQTSQSQSQPQSQQQPVKRQYNKQNSLLKKQQKLMLQQQQQLELQLKMQMQQQQQQQQQQSVASANQMSALTQFASLLELQQQQQLMIAFQQQLQQQQQQQQHQTPFSPKSSTSGVGGSAGKRKTSTQQSTSGSSSTQLDYLIKPHTKKVDRRHADPLVSFASILENILNELRDSPDAQPFLQPVNSKKVPDYYNIVKNPIDLQTIRKRINEKFYKNREMFLDDMRLLAENSSFYNGSTHVITASADNLYSICAQKFEEKKEKLIRLEKAINPLLDDNSLIAFNYLLEKVFEQNIMTVENSFAFLKPVNKAKYKDYYEIIKNPIDLETIKHKISNKKYKSREEFIADFELLFNNCLTYNGLNNSYTNTAQKLLNACKLACEMEHREQLQQLEEAIYEAMIHKSNENEDNQFKINHNIDTTTTDSESNLTPIRRLSSVIDESSQPSTSLLNIKKQPTNRNSIKLPKSAMATAMSGKNKKKQIFFPASIAAQSSRSGSDAEVFVDVESIDERVGGSGEQFFSQKFSASTALFNNQDENDDNEEFYNYNEENEYMHNDDVDGDVYENDAHLYNENFNN